MNLIFHPEFPHDVARFSLKYTEISERLGSRFRQEVEDALAHIKRSPESAGHFVNTGSQVVESCRRRNLVSFPFFVLYAPLRDLVIVGKLTPSGSDPLTWLDRF
jgi:hypothetical protein